MSTPAAPLWHCELKGTEQLTVGTPFDMNCSGDLAVQWSAATPKIVLPEKAQPYSLVVLSAKKLEANSAELVVTSYRPGDIKPEYVRVMTGDAGFEASGLSFKVQSVLKQGEQAKPYPPYGPLQLPMPIWVWIAVALLLATISSTLWIWFKRIQDRRRLAEDLGKHSSAVMTPNAQLHKDLRLLSRKLISATDAKAAGEWNASLEQALRIYLMLEFRYLTLRVPRSSLFSGWKRQNREAFTAHGATLRKIFSEMDRFQLHSQSHQAAEYEQILNLVRQWSDKIEMDRVKKQKGRL